MQTGMLRSVVTTPSRPVRARNAEEKQRRRDDILKSAERLWQNTSYADLSMNQVAREAQLAKGTLYLYFDTKEELFLALLIEHLRDWLGVFLAEIKRTSPQTAEQVADLVIQTSLNRESLRRLLVLLGTVLERNVQPDIARNFHSLIRQDVAAIVKLLPFSPTVSVRMLMHTYALSVGWHQATEARQPVETTHLPAEFQRPQFETEFALAIRASFKALAG